MKEAANISSHPGRRLRAFGRFVGLSALITVPTLVNLSPGGALLAGPAADSDHILQDATRALERRDPQGALKILDSLAPEDGDSHFRAGVMLAEHQLYAAAARQFGLARPTSKDPYLAGYNQTLAYLNAADYAAAIRTANELLNQGHETAELADVAAMAYLKSGQAQEAYNAFRLAAHLDPRNEEAYVELCEMSLDHDDYDRGLQIAEIGLRHLPGSERLYLQRGIMRAMKGQFDEGEKDFAKASELAPQEVLPAVSLGLIAMQKGNLDKAVATLRHAAGQHPESYVAQYWFAEALLRAGAASGTIRRDEALAALKQSVRLNPNFWHARADLGKLLLDRDEVDAAISELQKAASLNPSSTGPLYLLAQAYRRKGDESRAQELIAQVSKMQAEDRESLAQGGLRQLAREGKAAVPASQGQQH